MTSPRLRALVVAAHSDDEALGCGGTMARLSARGWDVGVMFMTNGVGARVGATSSEASERAAAAAAATAALGARILRQCDFPDNAMDSIPLLSLTQEIEAVSRDFRANIVLTHHAHDLNVDHRLVHQAVLTAFRPLPDSCLEAILCFEVASSTGWNSVALPAFQPTLGIDISGTFAHKLQALRCYDAEMRQAPHPRSPELVEATARFRGGAYGLMFAEAFEIQRMTLADRGSVLHCL